jgi:imidazolonepropionase-like amidohydrolase
VERIRAITDAGHAAGIRSIVHIGNSAEAIDAVRGGADALAHAPWREEISDEAVAVIAARRVPVVATLAVWDLSGTPRTRETDFIPIERVVGRPDVMSALLEPPPPADELTAAFMRAAAAAAPARRRNVAKLRAAGVTVLAGSDSCNPGNFPGAGLHLELAKLVEAGLTPAEALRTATWENARFLAGDGADFGEIAVGKRADLILVAGNPAASIATLAEIRQVLLDGTPLLPQRS